MWLRTANAPDQTGIQMCEHTAYSQGISVEGSHETVKESQRESYW